MPPPTVAMVAKINANAKNLERVIGNSSYN
jgi:hypothetical protein